MNSSDDRPDKRPSTRFDQSFFTTVLIPVILGTLGLVLLGTIVFIILFVVGVF